ncbi:MAG: AraC family transcriptional regulator ligand-binding domain-containing protein [bacterium]|nr:AraC family transcriptional regulator ligand-binding domain-containing protein [bacterium]
MAALSLIRACVLSPALAFLRRIGGAAEPLLVGVGLPASTLATPEGLIPSEAAARFLRNAARREGIDAFGALAGGEGGVEALGVFGALVCAAPTMRDALRECIAQRRRFASHGRIWLHERGADLELCLGVPHGGDPVWRQGEHYVVRLLLGVLRLGAGPTWRPPRVQFQTPEWAAARAVDAFAGARIDFGQRVAAITFPRRLLDVRLAAATMPCDGATVAAWRATAPAATFADAVAQVVETLTWERPPRVGETAVALGTTPRTLQRRLASYGVTHEALVDRARLASAASMLAETDARILEVALDIGYSDHAHFTRAFRRWCGQSPRDYRRTHLADVPAGAASTARVPCP